jgi:hypothetical protein
MRDVVDNGATILASGARIAAGGNVERDPIVADISAAPKAIVDALRARLGR